MSWPGGTSPGATLTGAELTWVRSAVAGTKTPVAASRNITSADSGLFLVPVAGVVLTIPLGLTPAPSFSVACPATGLVTVAVSGGATINGGILALTRARTTNTVGFSVFAHAETNAYGVSGT